MIYTVRGNQGEEIRFYTKQVIMLTALVDNGSQYNDPYLYRFTQPDSIVPNLYAPQSLNRYGYVLNNPIRYNDPSGNMCSDPEDPTPTCDGSGTTRVGDRMIIGEHVGGEITTSKPLTIPQNPTTSSSEASSENEDLVKGLRVAAAITQDIATGIDLTASVVEMFFIAIALPEGPEAIGTVILGIDIVYNLSGWNAAETVSSFASFVLTSTADYLEDGKLGEDFITSATTFGLGTLVGDPLADFVIDGYASGYTHGILNGVDTILNGGSFYKGELKWY